MKLDEIVTSEGQREKMMTRTKIVATIGPASEDEETIRRLAHEGMNVARINFSHCPYDEALTRIQNIKKVRKSLDIPLGIMLDTKGPEVRVYGYTQPLRIDRGARFIIESLPGEAASKAISPYENHLFTNLPNIDKLVSVGSLLLIQDGFVEAEVVAIGEDGPGQITARMNNPGLLKEKAHLSIPGAAYPLPFLSEKDRQDILFAVDNAFDFIALSFVRKADDIKLVREIIQAHKPSCIIKLIAKIEDGEALTNLDEIVTNSDGIMIARGDLGVELPIEQLPMIQKQTIERCYLSGKPVIVATQMLESMTEKTYPTRAEVTDVANAVIDMTSAVMLSGETAQGVHPCRVVNMMKRILYQTETQIDFRQAVRANRDSLVRDDLTNIMSYNAISTAHHSHADAIVCVTTTGYGARSISKFRPGVPIHAFTFCDEVYQQLSLSWGVTPHALRAPVESFEECVDIILQQCKERGIASTGQRVVFVAGVPFGIAGETNQIRVLTVP